MLTSPGWRGPTPQWQILLVFCLALVLGAMTTASLLAVASGLVAPAPEVFRHGLLICLLILFSIRELGLIALPLPQRAKLIPQSVFARDFPASVLQFGWELGTGIRTYVSSTTPYLLSVALFLGDPPIGALFAAGSSFGIGRAAAAVSRYASGKGERWDDLLERRLSIITRTAFAAAVLLGLWLFLQGEVG